MHIYRNQLFSAAAVFAIAMVVGAWTTSTRGGEEDFFEFTTLVDGYAAYVPDHREGALCIGHAATNGHEVGNVEWQWSGTHNFGGATWWPVQDYLGYTDGYAILYGIDDEDQEWTDDIWIDVSSTGEWCES